MNTSLMERLKNFLNREDNSKLVGVPASDDEIADAQQKLQVTFHSDYVQFIQTFGGAYAGISVHAFTNGSSIGKETVVELTLDYREQFMDHPVYEVLQQSYVISIDGSGDPIMIEKSGQVLICYHDTGELKSLADSFEELIEECFYEW